MGKLAQSTIKYLIEADFTANGVVEKPDVIGAIFGQTEGLLGQELDLRELQRTGRIGRIEVTLKTEEGKTRGRIIIPSSLDSSETALIAAAIETIERIGPCESSIKVKALKDVRTIKREYVVKRAKELLTQLLEKELPSGTELAEKIKELVRTAEITEYKGLPCGSDVPNSEEIILVEGRADVVNLLRYGIKNVIAIGGTKVPEQIIDLCKEKTTTLFIDGDRGGELILKELLQLTSIDFVAKAPEGKEVEELTKKEVFKALRDKLPVDVYLKSAEPDSEKELKRKILEVLDKLEEEDVAYIFDDNMRLLAKVPIKEFTKKNKHLVNGRIVVLGKLNKGIIDVAEYHNIKILAVPKLERKIKTSIKILTKDQLVGQTNS